MLPDSFTSVILALAASSLALFCWGLFDILSRSSGCM